MNLDDLEKKLNKISSQSKEYHNELEQIAKNISDKDETKRSRQEYYDFLSDSEREYQTNNDIYKDWVNGYSKAYIELSDFYKGEELPRKKTNKDDVIPGEHYLQSKKDIIELYQLFVYYGMMEHFLNLYI